MGLSPNEVSQTTIGRLAAAVRGYLRAQGADQESNQISDAAFDAYQEAKATHGVDVKEVSLTELMSRVPVRHN